MNTILENSSKITTSQDLYPIYEELHSFLTKKEFEKIDFIFENINFKEATEVFLVGLLRICYPWKLEIKKWENKVKKVEEELSSRNLNTEKLLIGLV